MKTHPETISQTFGDEALHADFFPCLNAVMGSISVYIH